MNEAEFPRFRLVDGKEALARHLVLPVADLHLQKPEEALEFPVGVGEECPAPQLPFGPGKKPLNDGLQKGMPGGHEDRLMPPGQLLGEGQLPVLGEDLAVAVLELPGKVPQLMGNAGDAP